MTSFPHSPRRLPFPAAACAVLLLIAAFFYSLTWGDRVVGYLSDDAIYLLMAEMFSPWKHATGVLFDYLRQDNHFPPLYPVLLGLFGADSRSPALAAAVSVGFLVIAVAAYGTWLYLETGRRRYALVLPLLFSALPGTLLFIQGLWSEFLFMGFFYGALALLADRTRTASHWLACSLFLALTAVTRAVGVAFIGAWCLFLLFERPRRYPVYMLVAALPFLYWVLFINIHATSHGYFGILLDALHSGQGHGAGLLRALPGKLLTMYDAWRWQFLAGGGRDAGGPVVNLLLPLLLAAALAGFGRRLLRRKPDALCLLVYVVTVLLWPFSDLNFVARFLFPVMPLLLFYVFTALEPPAGNPARGRAAAAAALAMLIGVAWPSTAFLVHRAYAAAPPGLAPYKHDRAWFVSIDHDAAVASARGTRDIFRALEQVAALVPETDCIFSVHTSLVMLYTHRISGVLPLPSASPRAFSRGTRGCRYMVALPLTTINNDYPEFYPLRRILGDNRYTIVPVMRDDPDATDQKPVLYLIHRSNGGR